MKERKPAWGGGAPEGSARCVACGGTFDVMELDRMLWCEECRVRARIRAGWWGWLAGLVFGAGLAAYVFLVIRPTDLVLGGWIATVVGGVWVGSRIGREIAYGVLRARTGGDA